MSEDGSTLDTPKQWDVTLNVPDVHNAIGVEFYWNRRRFYYTDVYVWMSSVGVDARNVSLTVWTNLTTPDGVAVDWLADNAYWTDAGSKVLEVSRLDGSCRKIVIGRTASRGCFPQRGYRIPLT
jgi:low-density lipoprotein receptor-related protein 4